MDNDALEVIYVLPEENTFFVPNEEPCVFSVPIDNVRGSNVNPT